MTAGGQVGGAGVHVVEFTDTEWQAVGVGLLATIDDLTERIARYARHTGDPAFAGHHDEYREYAERNALRRAQARQAYCALHGASPSHFTFEGRL